MIDNTYEEHAAHLSAPATDLPGSGSALHGAAAAAAGRSFLVETYGSEEAVEHAMRRGRPRLGQTSGASPEVRGRLIPAEFDALEKLRQQTGRSRSDLVREGIHLLLQKNKIDS